MKKLLKNKKFVLYATLIIVVLLMWACGSLNTTKSSASYKSEISSTDSTAKVAKWNIIDVAKKKGTNVDLEVGFSEKITDTDSGRSGDWFLELDNQSEVNAKIDLDSKISLQLHHDTFTGLKNTDWNFLGSVNPLKFTISLYQGSIDDVVSYNDGVNYITYDTYNGLSKEQQKNYTQQFDSSKLICLAINTNTVPSFTSSTLIGGKVVYFIEVTLKDIITDESLIEMLEFGLGEDRVSKVLHLSWDIDDSSIITVTNYNDLSKLSSNQKSESYTYVVSSTGKKYRYDSSSSSFIEIVVSNDLYKRYELSTIKGDIVDGTDPDGYKVQMGNDDEIYYLNEISCDFAEYFLFSHGEPVYTFGNSMIRFSLLSDEQKTQVQNRTIKNENSGAPTESMTFSDLKLYLEKLEYPQYDRFQGDYVSFASGSVYLSYGLSCKFVLDLKVVQVD